jgi:hypothetical protein
MTSGRRKSSMDGSWVVEDSDADDTPSWASDESPQQAKRGKKRATKSPTPEFRMPRVHANENMEASWTEERNQTLNQPRDSAANTRRRAVKSSVNEDAPARKKRTSPANGMKKHSQNSQPDNHDFSTILDTTLSYASMMLKWCLEVFGGALRVLKTPITYILAVWLLFGLGVVVRNLVTNSVYASLSPVCRIPGVSFLNLPFCPVYQADSSHGTPPPVEFEQLMTVQSKFEEVLEESAGGVSLPMDMKRGEASIRDLRQLVRYSQLHSR